MYKVITENNITVVIFKYLYNSIFKKWKPGKLNFKIKLTIIKYNWRFISELLKNNNSVKFKVPKVFITKYKPNRYNILVKKLLNKYNSNEFLYCIKVSCLKLKFTFKKKNKKLQHTTQ